MEQDKFKRIHYKQISYLQCNATGILQTIFRYIDTSRRFIKMKENSVQRKQNYNYSVTY